MALDLRNIFSQFQRSAARSLVAHFVSHGTGSQTGIEGSSDNGTGILGTGQEQGVFGLSDTVGVYGYSQEGEGVLGDNQSNTSAAVKGTNRGTGTGGIGVAGFSQTGRGVYGHSVSQAGVVGESDHFDGVYGVAHDVNRAGVTGSNPGGLAGFFDGKLQVTGDIDVGKNVRITGNLDVTGPGSDIRITNMDCAEDFDVCESSSAEPGSVMIFNDEGQLSLCARAYDKRAAGVISGAGSFKPAIVLGSQPALANRRPIALIGRVYCKVDAQYGAIEVGDLLTTSPTPGHAMAATEASRALGSVVGKALQSLSTGLGCIPILVGLQ